MRLAADGSAGTWGVFDETSGRIMNTLAFDQGINRTMELQNVGDVTRTGPTVSPTGATDVILGHTVTKYTYEYGMRLEPFGSGQPRIENIVEGEAWVAADTAIAKSFNEARLFSVIASGIVGTDLGLGMPLRTSETTTVIIEGSGPQARMVVQGSSSSEVTSISRRALDNALFGVDQPAVKQCDCSCDAYKKLMAIGELPEAEQQAHPDAMPLAMCAPRCGFQWATACKAQPR